MGTLKDIGYKVVKNFITIEEANLIKEYCILRHTDVIRFVGNVITDYINE